VQPEAAVPGMSAYLDTLRWSKDGLVPVIVQVCNVSVPITLACSSECSTAHAAIEAFIAASGWAAHIVKALHLLAV
jgi:hypothetical protein